MILIRFWTVPGAKLRAGFEFEVVFVDGVVAEAISVEGTDLGGRLGGSLKYVLESP
jgi:hypothetical protein